MDTKVALVATERELQQLKRTWDTTVAGAVRAGAEVPLSASSSWNLSRCERTDAEL